MNYYNAVKFLSLLSLLSLVTPAQAGKIVDFEWFSGVASVAGVSIPPPVAPGNDDVVGSSPNELRVTQKDYTAIGPVDIEFTVMPSDGTTEYTILEGVSNSTGIDWSGYTLQLGFGVGSDFVPSDSGDGLDFDAPDYNSPVDFDPFPLFPFPTLVTWDEDLIEVGGGLGLMNTQFAEPLVFPIDVPDGIERFTLRQQPIGVPEPSSFSLLLLTGFALLRNSRR